MCVSVVAFTFSTNLLNKVLKCENHMFNPFDNRYSIEEGSSVRVCDHFYQRQTHSNMCKCGGIYIQY